MAWLQWLASSTTVKLFNIWKCDVNTMRARGVRYVLTSDMQCNGLLYMDVVLCYMYNCFAAIENGKNECTLKRHVKTFTEGIWTWSAGKLDMARSWLYRNRSL